MVYFIYSVVTVLLLFWLAVCLLVASFWMLRRLARIRSRRALTHCRRVRAKGARKAVMLFVAIVLSAVFGCLAGSGYAEGATPTSTAPAAKPTEDIDSAYINSVKQYGDSLKVYAESIRSNAQTAIPSAPPTPDLWSTPPFQALMNTLWQAPLLILAIVLSVAALVGWQGYQEIKETLYSDLKKRQDEFKEEQKQLEAEVAQSASMAIAAGQTDAAYQSWLLARDLVKEAKKVTEAQMDEKLPPGDFLDAPGALSHVRFAKNLCNRALLYLAQLPDQLQITFFGRSKKYLELEARQSYAYYVATDYNNSSAREWEEALGSSERALAELRSEWLTQQEDYEEVQELWIDTYLYVRVIYLLKQDVNYPEAAKQEFLRAAEVFRDQVADKAALLDIKERFKPLLEAPNDFLRSRGL